MKPLNHSVELHHALMQFVLAFANLFLELLDVLTRLLRTLALRFAIPFFLLGLGRGPRILGSAEGEGQHQQASARDAEQTAKGQRSWSFAEPNHGHSPFKKLQVLRSDCQHWQRLPGQIR
jgi:hypothetical protein